MAGGMRSGSTTGATTCRPASPGGFAARSRPGTRSGWNGCRMCAVSSVRKASVRQDEERVIVIVDGKAVLNLPWEAALEIGQAICQQARRAEEIAKATLVIRDQAIVLRAGGPIGLGVGPRIPRGGAR